MPAGSVTGRLNLNAAGWSSAVDKAKKEIQGLQDASEKMGHGTVTQMQAASASIRLIEGDMTRNVRAVEKFITTIPGIGAALKSAFPLVGAIATIGIIAKIGEEAYNAVKKVQQAGQQIDNSFRELNLSGQTANDQLAITNDRLESEIAKLQGKPQNNLALALDEARLAADKMAESLDRDNSKIKELLSQNAVPWWAGFMGKAGTSSLSDTVNKQNQNLSDLGAQANILQHSGDQAGADRKRAEIDATRQQYLRDNAADMAARRSNQGQPGALNQGANISIDLGQQSSLMNQIDQQMQLARNQKDEQVKAQLESAKAMSEAAKKAQAELLKVFEEQEKQVNAWNKMTVNQEIQFWHDRIGAFTKGGEQYRQVQEKIYEEISKRPDLTAENKKNLAATGKSQVEGNDMLGAGAEALLRPQREEWEKMAEAAKKYNEIVAQGEEIQRKNETAFAETSIAIALAQGSMSKLDGAQALAAVHAQDHADALELVNKHLQEQINLINAIPKEKMTDREKAAAIASAQNQAGNQRAVIEGSYARTRAQDQADISGNTVSGAVRNSLSQMVQAFTDMAANLKDVIPRTIEGLNDDIAKLATGQGRKGDFGQTLKGAGEGLVKTGLQSAEGQLLGMFGLGKKAPPGSSPTNPSYSVIVGGGTGAGIGGGSSPGLGSILGKIPGIGQFIQPFSGLLPHFAGGGDVLANHPIMVGENGPEPFIPRSAGTIIPNHMMGGSDTHFHIDARGSNDPMAVHAAIMRAAPHIAAAAVQASHSSAKRSPGGK